MNVEERRRIMNSDFDHLWSYKFLPLSIKPLQKTPRLHQKVMNNIKVQLPGHIYVSNHESKHLKWWRLQDCFPSLHLGTDSNSTWRWNRITNKKIIKNTLPMLPWGQRSNFWPIFPTNDPDGISKPVTLYNFIQDIQNALKP